uniref:F-box family protein n=1 Tax=Rhizophora mucronata TaxID=61149 RepID=A0A2P2L562_RHIMU
MSNGIVHLHHDGDEVDEKSMQPYQRAWMARWMRTSCGSTSAAHDQLSLGCESREENRCTKHQLEPTGKERREASKGKMIDFVDESLAISSGKQRDDAFEEPASVIFKLPQNSKSVLALERGQSSRCQQDILRPQVDPNFGYDDSPDGIQNSSFSISSLPTSEAEIPSRDFRCQPEGISLTPELQVKSDKPIGKSTLAALPYFQDDNLGLTSKIVAYEAYGRSTPMHPFFRHESNNPSGATSVAHQKKMDTSATILVRDPTMDADQLRNFIRRPFQMKPKHSDVELFPSWIGPPETRNLRNLHNGSYAPTWKPSSIHDMETMGIRATIDSVEEYPKVPQKFSKTTHQFFFTRKTGVNLFDGSQMFGESLHTSEGKKANDFPCLSPDFTFHIKQGSKLQLLGSFIESARREDTEHVKTSTFDLKNESSAETDTMDTDVFRNSHLFGVGSSQSNKDIKGEQKPLASDAEVASTREGIRSKHPNTEIPDINEELPAFPGLTSSANGKETSTSRTQSLDVEHFLSHAERPTNWESGACSDGPLGLDPCSRWVKRLKSSASNSIACGTKGSRMEEASSHEKVKLFNKILKCTKTTTERKMCESNDKYQTEVDPTSEELKKAESFCIESSKKSEDVKLLHAWIQRWCHNPAASPEQRSETEMVCKPHKSKSILHDLQKKHFPSIAAMALMGKVMTGFHPCEFRKKGSSVVWNSERY